MDTSKAITHLSLCTGYEGIGLGLRRIWPDIREIAYVEIEAFAIANLVSKMEEGKIHEDRMIRSNLRGWDTYPKENFMDVIVEDGR